MLIRSICGGKIVVRTRSSEYFDAWRAGHLDVDFIVSSEQETAQAVARAIGYPNAVQTDVFAGGRVEMVEFAVDSGRHRRPRRPHAGGGADSGRQRGGVDHPARPRDHPPRRRHDRGRATGIVLIASPAAAREWARRLSPAGRDIGEVVVFGGGETGTSIAGVLAGLELNVSLVERSESRARLVAERLSNVRVFHADATDGDFLEREAVGRADAAVCCTDDDGSRPAAGADRPSDRRRHRARGRRQPRVHPGLPRRGRGAGRERAAGDGGGDRAVHPRPAHQRVRDARERPGGGARARGAAVQRAARPAVRRAPAGGRDRRCDRPRRQGRLPARRRQPAGRRPRDPRRRRTQRADAWRRLSERPLRGGRPQRRPCGRHAGAVVLAHARHPGRRRARLRRADAAVPRAARRRHRARPGARAPARQRARRRRPRGLRRRGARLAASWPGSRRCRTSSTAATPRGRSTRSSRACRASPRPARASSSTSPATTARCCSGGRSRSGSAAWGSSCSRSRSCPGMSMGGRGLAERETSGHDYQKLLPRARELGGPAVAALRRAVGGGVRWRSRCSA